MRSGYDALGILKKACVDFNIKRNWNPRQRSALFYTKVSKLLMEVDLPEFVSLLKGSEHVWPH